MKLKIKNEYLILFLLFLFVLIFRLYFAFQIDNFNTDSAYFHLGHIENIVNDKALLFYDDLSYGGRFVLYPPLFHLIMAFLSFGSIFMLKLIPEIFISLTVFVVYLISKDISGSSYAALISAFLASFYPILFKETLNNLSVYNFIIPLVLLMFYSLLKIDDKKYLWIFIISSFLLPLFHPSAFLFIVTAFFYFIILAGGAVNPTKLKKEAVIFASFLIVLLEFIIYKKAFFEYGAGILWYNIPANIFSDAFRQISFLDLLVGVGILPLILGSIGIYISIIRDKRKITYLFSAFAISILLLIVLRLLTISIGLMYLGIILSIFSASSVFFIYDYLNKLKFSYAKHIFVFMLLFLILFSSLSPSFLAAKESNEIGLSKIRQVKWLEVNTEADAVVLGNIDEGNLISVAGKRKNVLDTNFLLAPNPIERSSDMEVIYTTVSEAIAINLIRKYNIDVIYLSDETRDGYGIWNLKYAEDSECFESVRGGTYYVFRC